MIRSVACPLIAAILAWFVAVLPASAQGFVGPYAASNWTVTGMQPFFANSSTRIEPGGMFILEHQAKRTISSIYEPAEVRLYGNCAFSFYTLNSSKD